VPAVILSGSPQSASAVLQDRVVRLRRSFRTPRRDSLRYSADGLGGLQARTDSFKDIN
jgi:hypothetical protein